MLELRSRRGAVAILTVLLFLALMVIFAVVIDFSRIQMQRNQLQTAVDAAAVAGAVQLVRTPKTDALSKVKEFGAYNKALSTSVTIDDDDVEFGIWDPLARNNDGNWSVGKFTPQAGVLTADAVRVTVWRPAKYLVGGLFGFAQKGVTVSAVAWAGAPVESTECMKPWAIPYTLLMDAINAYRGMTGESNTRPMTPEDLQALREMSEADRTFTLHLGQEGNQPEPGNFYAVQLPPIEYADGSEPDVEEDPGCGGACAYKKHLTGETCARVGVGDILLTQTGAMTGPTCGAVIGSESCNPNAGNLSDPRVCHSLTNGICVDADGNPVVIKSAFWHLYDTRAQGQFSVEVAILGSFVLQNFYTQPGANSGCSRGCIQGIFQPIDDAGPIGNVTTTLSRPVLVR